MTMLDDVLGAAVPGAKNRICTLWRRRKAKPGSDPSSTGMFVGKCLIAVLICAGAALMMPDAASAKAKKGGAKASAPAALDAQAIDAAQLPAPSGKGRARAPSAAALIKGRYCSIAPASHPARSTARPVATIKRLSPRFRTQTESSRAATSTRKPGSA